MKNWLWKILGFLSLGMAYIGVITPGIPYSIFIVFAAYCFAKSSPKMHAWIYGHPKFGPFLRNWTEKRIFPQKMKYLMIATMLSTLIFTWFISEGNVKAVAWSGSFMFLVAVWAWRYPPTEEEYNRRKAAGERIAWIK